MTRTLTNLLPAYTAGSFKHAQTQINLGGRWSGSRS